MKHRSLQDTVNHQQNIHRIINYLNYFCNCKWPISMYDYYVPIQYIFNSLINFKGQMRAYKTHDSLAWMRRILTEQLPKDVVWA